MVYKSVTEDVIFIEGEEPQATIVDNVKYTYGSFGSQLKNLLDVKKNLANQAKFKKCNCIINFKYGQKSSWFSLDDTKWYGNGQCGILDEKCYKRYLDQIISKQKKF